MKSLDNSPFLSIGYVFPLGEKVHPLPVSPLLAPDGGYLSCPLVGGGWEVEEGGSGGGGAEEAVEEEEAVPSATFLPSSSSSV